MAVYQEEPTGVAENGCFLLFYEISAAEFTVVKREYLN